MLTKQQLMAATDRATKTLTVPAWGGDVVIGTISRARQLAIQREVTDAEGTEDEDLLARLHFQACMIEPALTLDDVARLWDNNLYAINFILREFYALCRMTAEGYATKAGVEDAERKFRDGPASDVRDATGGEPGDDAGDAAGVDAG